MLNLSELRRRISISNEIRTSGAPHFTANEVSQLLDIVEAAKRGLDESDKHDDSGVNADYDKLRDYRRKFRKLLEDVEVGDE